MRLFSVALLVTILLCFADLVITSEVTGEDKQPARIDFDDQIAPLLARRCLDCHNATEHKGGLDLSRVATTRTGGDSGEVIVPGKLDESLLWDQIESDEMPPKKPLSAEEKKLVKAWIVGGAKWGTDPINPFRATTKSRAGYDWWCLQPVVKPALPRNLNSDWPRNSIDRFVLARLKEKGLSPAPETERRTLIRRLSFDLIGLPPSPEEIEAFVADISPDAYSELVDRLLASPHYGERWARHWLDVVRYGESQGFERDKLRENAWVYRDWVVGALNDDLPYNEFAKLQLAGDLLHPQDPFAIAATGMLVAGPYDEVGNLQQSAAMRAIVRQDALEDMVSTVGQTFLGLTVNCARCHDHKFDPVLQSEYYRMTAALDGVRHGERDFDPSGLREEVRARVASLQSRFDALSQEKAALTGPIRARIVARRKVGQSTAKPPQPLAEWRFDGDLSDSLGELDGTAHGKATVNAGRLVLGGKDAYVSTRPLNVNLSAKTLEAWVLLDNLKQQGGGVLSVQTLNGVVFDAIVYGEREANRWMAGSNGFQRTKSFAGNAETTAETRLVHVAIVYRADGTIIGYRNGHPYGKAYRSSGPVTFSAGDSQVLFGLRHGSPGGNRILSGAIDRARLYDRALSHAEVAASAGVQNLTVDDADVLAEAGPELRKRYETLSRELLNLKEQLQRYQISKVYANVPQPASVVHVLKRGNTKQPGEAVAAGGIAAIKGVSADFGLATDAPEADRRLKLAEWIIDADNPLFARVIVNRLWHYHFGVGLVETPNDFGFNGGRPSHPQLIDWLAAELIEKKWSLKSLHRAIVMSATYRQSSRWSAAAAKIDGDNRLYWRMSPRRLEAEAVRDTVLSVAGQLNREIGGPGYKDFKTYVQNAQFYKMLDPVGPRFNRRSLYRTWVRSGRNQFLDVFDCPDPSTKTPARAVTTTPLQALSMMNNSFVLRMADRFADRLKKEFGNGASEQIAGAYRLAYGRAPVAAEITAGAEFVADYGLSAYCRVIFNSNEFLYVD